MAETTGRIIPIAIEDEIKGSYLTYAMSVIVSRALPDVRDGLKPVHRRILFAMDEMGLASDKPYKKAGRIVGDVLGKFHPHGDQSIYDALVRMAQDFSLRYPLVHGQGNFGSVDGDPPAAMRYTEARMYPVAEAMLADIGKETVDFVPNYDDSLKEPSVLPSAFPFLLTNGANGIAVGMATNMAPHNLGEIVDAITGVIDRPDLSFQELVGIVKGPDFPTGGIILGKKGIRKAYKTGRGQVMVRAKCLLETTKSGREVIIVKEIPYMVNKATLIMRIADLVKEKRIDGIHDLRDESDRDGMRIYIELKKDAVPKVVMNHLFTHTPMQSSFNINSLALVKGMPRLLSLRELIDCFIDHRKDVVTRRCRYELRKAEEREHILLGLMIALENIDEVVAIIKKAKDVESARMALMSRFNLSEKQAQAILDMRLQRLTSLETRKIIEELQELQALIAKLKDILSSEAKVLVVVKTELLEIRKKFADKRRTEIIEDEAEEINAEDLIQKENVVIPISNKGFIKRIPVSDYKNQNRGGKGFSSTKLKEEEFVQQIFIASTHDYIMFVTSEGKAYWMKVHEIPEGSRTARGQNIKALLAISANEEITSVLSFKNFADDRFIFMATRKGIVKKVQISQFENAKTRGIRAVLLDNDDKLVSCIVTTGNDELVLVSKSGHALRIHEQKVRTLGRSSRGVNGMRLGQTDELTAVIRVVEGSDMLLMSENGYGKRTAFENFAVHGRGTGGQICYKTNDKTGELIGALSVNDGMELVCITSQGNTVKLRVKNIPVLGKNAFGVRIVTIEKPDVLVDIAPVMKDDEDEEEEKADQNTVFVSAGEESETFETPEEEEIEDKVDVEEEVLDEVTDEDVEEDKADAEDEESSKE